MNAQRDPGKMAQRRIRCRERGIPTATEGTSSLRRERRPYCDGRDVLAVAEEASPLRRGYVLAVAEEMSPPYL